MGRSQLHALIHSETTIMDVPTITRWVWHLYTKNSISTDKLFLEAPSRESLIQSCRQEIVNLYDQFNRSVIRYREWAVNGDVNLYSRNMRISSEELFQSAYRYFVLAAASDTAAALGEFVKKYEWLRSNLPPESSCVLKNVIQDRNVKMRREQVGMFLKSLMTVLQKAKSEY